MAQRQRPRHQGRGVDAKGRSKSDGGYVKLDYWILETEAFQALSIAAEHILLGIFKRYNGANNGRISFGCRSGCLTRRGGQWIEMLAKVSRSVQARALLELQEQGFIECTQDSSFGQKRLVKNWRLTWLRDDRNAAMPTKEFARPAGQRSTIAAEQKLKASPSSGTMGSNIVPLEGLSPKPKTQKPALQSLGRDYAARS